MQATSAGVTLAASSELTNLANSLTFTALAQSLVFNNNQPVSLTFGTYSGLIEVRPNTGAEFLTNLQLTFSASGLTFLPQVLEIGIGQTAGYFQVGGDINLLLSTISYSVSKAEQSGTNLYSVPSDLTVVVVDTPVPIVLPAAVSVPIGGCSLPVKVVLPNSPFSQVSVNYQYNSSLYNESLFYINQVTSGSSLAFSQGSRYQLMSFCSTPQIAISSLPITLALSGNQQQSYSLSVSTLTVNFVSQAAVAPTLALAVGTAQRLVVPVTATANQPGTLYYQFFVTGTAIASEVVDLELHAKNEVQIVEGGGGPMAPTVYSRLRDNRVGVMVVSLGDNSFALEGLHPDTPYTVCGYLLTQFLAPTAAVCANVTTAAWGPLQKAFFTFSKDLSTAEMNRLLCYLIKKVSTQGKFLVNSRGESCSFSSAPVNLHYTYGGQTADYSVRQTIVYLVPDPAQGVDPAVASFRGLFDASSSSLTASTLSDALSTSSIAFIASGLLQPPLPLSVSRLDSIANLTLATSGNPAVLLAAGKADVSLVNVTLDQPGAYYLLFSREKYIQDNGNVTLYIRLNPDPSPQQVLQCADFYGLTADGCARVIVTDQESVTLTVSGLEVDSFYRVFTILAD